MTANHFAYITAGLYWCLIVCWLLILLFYWREYRRMTALSPIVTTMLVVVFIDGARTLIESIYFGTWYTARTGLIPSFLYDTLAEPHLVIIPKIFNLLSALTIIVVLVRKWFPDLKADIERQKHTEQLYAELQHAHEDLKVAQEARDALSHMIVHDMRTPLTNIISGLQTVQQLEETTELGEEMVGGALTGANRLLTMVNDLLDISKMESGEMSLFRERFPIREVVTEAVSLVDALAREKNLALTQELPFAEEEGIVDADREKAVRILLNLLGNAIKFTPDNGAITIRARQDGDSMLRISVSDTGPGIAPEHQTRIFEKFFQIQPGTKRNVAATGLGLTFCKMAVEAQGGEIGVESSPGKGSTFWFTLPAVPAQVLTPAR